MTTVVLLTRQYQFRGDAYTVPGEKNERNSAAQQFAALCSFAPVSLPAPFI
jgi:hypothetical protein